MGRNYLYLFCVVLAGLVFIGCGGGSSDIVKTFEPPEIVTPAKQVSPDGTITIDTISGLMLKADQENTFDPTVSVQIKEKDLISPESKYFSNASRLYTVSAYKTYKDNLGIEKTANVENVEKAILLAIPNTSQNRKGTYLIAFRESNMYDWKYSIINDDNSESNPMAFSSRLSQDNYRPVFFVSTYDVNMQFMIFYTDSETLLKKAMMSDFVLNEAKPLKIKTEPAYYTEDLKIKIGFNGESLTNLKPNDVTVRIDFFNNDSTEYSPSRIPVTGATSKTSISHKDAGSGNNYIHSMTLSNITDFSSSQRVSFYMTGYIQ